MKKNLFRVYKLLLTFYTFMTIIELILFFLKDASNYNFFYLICSVVINILLFIVVFNYKKDLIKKRTYKNIIIITLGLFSSYLLSILLNSIFSYIEINSFKLLITSKIIKPIIYLMIGLLTYLEYNNKTKIIDFIDKNLSFLK